MRSALPGIPAQTTAQQRALLGTRQASGGHWIHQCCSEPGMEVLAHVERASDLARGLQQRLGDLRPIGQAVHKDVNLPKVCLNVLRYLGHCEALTGCCCIPLVGGDLKQSHSCQPGSCNVPFQHAVSVQSHGRLALYGLPHSCGSLRTAQCHQ